MNNNSDRNGQSNPSNNGNDLQNLNNNGNGQPNPSNNGNDLQNLNNNGNGQQYPNNNNFNPNNGGYPNPGYPNGGYPNANYPNGGYPNPGYPNNYGNQSGFGFQLVKSCKSISIAYIVLWALEIFFVIFGCAIPFAFIIMLPLAVIVGIILFILGIVLIVKTSTLKGCYPNHGSLWIWFLVGLFLFGIFSFIGSILTVSACNKIESEESGVYNQPGPRY